MFLVRKRNPLIKDSLGAGIKWGTTDEKVLQECFGEIRNASVSIEGCLLRVAKKDVNWCKGLIEIAIEIRRIHMALKMLQGQGL